MTHTVPFARTLALTISTAALAATLTFGAAHAAETVRTGQLSGLSDHITTGTVTIERDGDTYFVVLGEDFSLDGAPDPSLGFSSGGEYVEASKVSDLNALTGEQRYEIPASVDPADFDAFVVWCAQFSVPLGSADLN
jgi:hypothetical protein